MIMVTISFAQILRPGVYVQEVPSSTPAIEAVETSTAIFIGHTKTGVGRTRLITSLGDYTRFFGNKADNFFLYESISLFFQNGGQRCFVVSAGGFMRPPTLRSLTRGLNRSKAAKGQIVTIPDAALLPQADFFSLQNELLQSCEESGDRFAILSTFLPTGETIQFINEFRNGIDPSGFGAVYYPWVTTPENTLPPVGAIAGIYVQQDIKRGVWKAPANVNINGITGLSKSITNREQSFLNVDPDEGKSINALRTFTGKGHLVWGSRTLAGNDNEWRYVPVRRFSIMVENSIKDGLDWVVFEPNDEPLWTQVIGSVDNFLNLLWKQGALQGTKSEKAYYVSCGFNRTMTQRDLKNGKMNLEIGMAPVRPAEFIIRKFEFDMR